jgi:hypothetical protein
MVKYLHTNYLASRDAYAAAVSYWQRVCQEIVYKAGQVDLWKPWFGIHQTDSAAPIEEGSIFSLHSQVQNKAINIEQYMPKSGKVEISATLDTFGVGTLETPIKYLTITCALSDGAARVAQLLIEKWIEVGTSVSDMETFINQTIGEQNK